jgi:hypothetical protein
LRQKSPSPITLEKEKKMRQIFWTHSVGQHMKTNSSSFYLSFCQKKNNNKNNNQEKKNDFSE